MATLGNPRRSRRGVVNEIALRLLDEYDRAGIEWSQEVGIKIDEAIATSEHTQPIDGETFVAGILRVVNARRNFTSIFEESN